jgi:hypothetical protein
MCSSKDAASALNFHAQPFSNISRPAHQNRVELNAMPLSSGQARFPFADVLERGCAA